MFDTRHLPSASVGLCLALLFGVTADAPAADLGEIRETLREIQTSFASLRMTYVCRSEVDVEYELIESGTSRRFTTHAPDQSESVTSFDGEFGYLSLRHKLVEPIESITKYVTEPVGLRGESTPLVWFGMPVRGVEKPLYEALEHATITGESTHGALPVVDVDLGVHTPFADHPDHRLRITAKLSPDHDYLPVVVSLKPLNDEAPYPDFVVETFRQVDHPLLQSSISFPDVMTFGPGIKIELKTIELNPQIAKSEFVPTPDVGTEIIDKSKTGAPRLQVHGGPGTQANILKRLQPAVPLSPPPAGSGIAAVRPDHGLTSFHWLLIAAGSFGVAGFLWKLRSAC